MSEPELLAILESKTNEIDFLKKEVKALTCIIRNMTEVHEIMGHPIEEEPEMKTVSLEDLLENFEARDDFCNWLLRNSTKGQPKKGLKKKK